MWQCIENTSNHSEAATSQKMGSDPPWYHQDPLCFLYAYLSLIISYTEQNFFLLLFWINSYIEGFLTFILLKSSIASSFTVTPGAIVPAAVAVVLGAWAQWQWGKQEGQEGSGKCRPIGSCSQRGGSLSLISQAQFQTCVDYFYYERQKETEAHEI